MTDMATTNFWLAVLVGVGCLQTAVMVVVAVRAMRLVTQAQDTLIRTERAIAPLAADAAACLTELRAVCTTARQMERQVREAAEALAQHATRLRAAFTARFWPVIGLARAARTVAHALSHRRGSRAAPDDDLLDVSRFVSEGGAIHEARSRDY